MLRVNRTNVILAAVLFVVSILNAGGTVRGVVTYDGPVPRMKAIKMAADPVCAAKHDKPVESEWLLLGENQEVANVFIYVKEGLEGKTFPVPEEPVVLDQAGCVYSPHVFGIQVSQPLDILNSDGTLHNVHATAKENRGFNEAMPAVRKKITKTFDKSEIMIKVKCDVHPWMECYVGAVDHPYFTVTDNTGVFEIQNLPPGAYTIEAWHERLKTRTATVTVKEGEVTSFDFTFTRPQKEK